MAPQLTSMCMRTIQKCSVLPCKCNNGFPLQRCGATKYRVSMKSFPDYKHLLQENYVEYKHFFFKVRI